MRSGLDDIWDRTLLLIVSIGLGVQCIAAPDKQLTARPYAHLESLGQFGWQVIGILLIASAVLIASSTTHIVGSVLGLFLFGVLLVSAGSSWYWPALSIFGAGLHAKHFWHWAKQRPPNGRVKG